MPDRNSIDTPDFMIPPSDALEGAAGLIWLNDDGIIIDIIDAGKPVHNREHAIEHIKVYQQIAGTIARPLMVDITNIRSLERGAREVYANPANADFVSAVALITNSTISRVVGNFYISIHNNPTPIKLFKEPRKAKEWLMNYK